MKIFIKIDFLSPYDVYFPKMIIFEISDQNEVIYIPKEVEKNDIFIAPKDVQKRQNPAIDHVER